MKSLGNKWKKKTEDEGGSRTRSRKRRRNCEQADTRKRSKNAVDKVFGRRRRKGQAGQTTQRQSTDSPACQGKILLERFSMRLSRGESRGELNENSLYLNYFFGRILQSTILFTSFLRGVSSNLNAKGYNNYIIYWNFSKK